MRPSKRQFDEMRAISFERNVSKHAEGSCLVKFGDTHVLCTASLEEKVPGWMRNSGKGWVTAEYGMLPRSTGERMRREASAGKQGGRTLEIQRLIGRSAAGRGRPRRARRAADHRRLRRDPGRRRHAHGLDHRRLGGAPRLPALDGGAADGERAEGAAATMSRRSPAASMTGSRCSTSTMSRIRPPAPTPISS